MDRSIAVVGLGYVGLPLAVAFGKKAPVIGFDIDSAKVAELRRGHDRTGETGTEELAGAQIEFTADPADLGPADFVIVAVPTPVDVVNSPDLSLLKRASELVASHLHTGDIVVFESTVYPGATEEVCVPILEGASGKRCGLDFKVGYSPERINPGDKAHGLEQITKVVAGIDAESLNVIAEVYGMVVAAGIHRAPNIQTAEAAKVIENTQRDINIALMNELAMIFHRLGIDTGDVLEAAATKWNFLPFRPGLVGGHCIGVDPYYLTYKAENVGYHPQMILAGRRINDSMGKYVAEQAVKLMIHQGINVRDARVAVLGLTFKENVSDIRNSRTVDVIRELEDYGIECRIWDPLVDPADARKEYGIRLAEEENLADSDAAIITVAHREFVKRGPEWFQSLLRLSSGGIVVDVRSVFGPEDFPGSVYWRL
jgi:UDP-N-acetyl-D-galactosamine dehydrogenase